jgi:hypothetical protein
MPRFYLHLRDHSDELLDPDGCEFIDLDAVRRAVVASARDVLANEIKSGGLIDFRFRIDAEDSDGEVVYTLPFSNAVTIIPQAA